MTERTRRPSGRAATAATAVAALLVAAGCAQETEDALAGDGPGAGPGSTTVPEDDGDGDIETLAPEGFAATPDYLDDVASSAAAESYAFEMSLRTGDTGPSISISSGAQDGERLRTVVELAAGPGGGGGASLEVITLTPEETYMQVPFLADVPDGRLTPEQQELKDLVAATDGWLRYDPSQVIESEDVPATASSGPQQDPTTIVELISAAGSSRELYPEEVQGEEMVGVAAEVPFSDLLTAEGTDPDTVADVYSQMFRGMAESQGAAPGEAEEFTDVMLDVMFELTMPVEARIDAAGNLRRLSYTMDMTVFLEALAERLDAPEMAEQVPPGSAVTSVMDLFDHGEPQDIEAPANAVDVRDRPELFDYWGLIELVSPSGPGAAPAPGGGPGGLPTAVGSGDAHDH